MVSERINVLFKILGCGNTEIARFAGCSSGNISKLKTGNREPLPTSRSIVSFANGVYGYADYENLLPELKELCGSSDFTPENLIPSLISWLYRSDEIVIPEQIAEPKSKRMQVLLRKQFGSRLDSAVTLLGLSNSSVASYLNIDVSLISRYRSGICSPHRNKQLSERLSELLVSRAQKLDKTKELAALCETDEAHLDTDTVWAWLFSSPVLEDSAKVFAVLQSLDALIPSGDAPDSIRSVPEAAEAPDNNYYYNIDGRRAAIARFLNEAASEGGELIMYSDEPSDIILGVDTYFKQWKALMENCVNHGVKIKIIHNIGRDKTKIARAVNQWTPLYLSGMIEPYAYRERRDVRFYHTLFLRPGKACVHGFFPVCSDNRWYEYITDPARLEILKSELDSMLAAALPIMKVFRSGNTEEFGAFDQIMRTARSFLLTEFPVFTMPEKLFERVISRAVMAETLRGFLRDHYRDLRAHFHTLLESGTVNMILGAPEDNTNQNRVVNFALDLVDLQVEYTHDEYAEHIASIIDLVENEKNLHLTLLPKYPSREIQVVLTDNAALITYCRKTINALAFFDAEMKESLSSWFSEMLDFYSDDRRIIIEKLEKLSN